MDRPQDRPADYEAPDMPGEAELRVAMERSARETAAGRTVPVADVLADLDEVVHRIEARRRAHQA